MFPVSSYLQMPVFTDICKNVFYVTYSFHSTDGLSFRYDAQCHNYLSATVYYDSLDSNAGCSKPIMWQTNIMWNIGLVYFGH